MSVKYLVEVSCDHAGCKRFALAPGSTDVLNHGWAMLPDGWRCPEHAEQWLRVQDTTEPTDEELLS